MTPASGESEPPFSADGRLICGFDDDDDEDVDDAAYGTDGDGGGDDGDDLVYGQPVDERVLAM